MQTFRQYHQNLSPNKLLVIFLSYTILKVHDKRKIANRGACIEMSAGRETGIRNITVLITLHIFVRPKNCACRKQYSVTIPNISVKIISEEIIY